MQLGHVTRHRLSPRLGNLLQNQTAQEEKLKDCIIYKMEHNLIDIPLDHYIQHNTRSSRKHDSQFLQIRYSANIFGNSFFPTTIKEWNSLPPNTVSCKSLNSFQNSLIQHFNNQVRRPTHAHWRDVSLGPRDTPRLGHFASYRYRT